MECSTWTGGKTANWIGSGSGKTQMAFDRRSSWCSGLFGRSPLSPSLLSPQMRCVYESGDAKDEATTLLLYGPLFACSDHKKAILMSWLTGLRRKSVAFVQGT